MSEFARTKNLVAANFPENARLRREGQPKSVEERAFDSAREYSGV
ncbi:hypothetical protein QCE73_06795 [Caballeronia sp. LZ029]|nr:hypothetical protein [Caballeronia sp. LZ029]MDR5742861.1 hypothetical protein [Caballeronia sp. LZ029]